MTVTEEPKHHRLQYWMHYLSGTSVMSKEQNACIFPGELVISKMRNISLNCENGIKTLMLQT